MKTLKHIVLLMLSLASLQSYAFLPKASVKSPGQNLPKENIVYRGTPVAEGGETWKSTVQIMFNGAGCTASFYDDRTLITAAHCVKNHDTSVIGINLFRGSEVADYKYYTSADYFIKYNRNYAGAYSHDFAVIVFRESLYSWDSGYKGLSWIYQGIDSAIGYGGKVYISGAGTTTRNGTDDNQTLYFGTGKISGYPFGDALEISMNTPYGICKGDSGSPVTVKVDGVFYLVGVVSAGTENIGSACGTTTEAAFLTAGDADWLTAAIEEGVQSFQ
jgi:V8-like Glu-specific endopeptidase